jgi:hypothetical protein
MKANFVGIILVALFFTSCGGTRTEESNARMVDLQQQVVDLRDQINWMDHRLDLGIAGQTQEPTFAAAKVSTSAPAPVPLPRAEPIFATPDIVDIGPAFSRGQGKIIVTEVAQPATVIEIVREEPVISGYYVGTGWNYGVNYNGYYGSVYANPVRHYPAYNSRPYSQQLPFSPRFYHGENHPPGNHPPGNHPPGNSRPAQEGRR